MCNLQYKTIIWLFTILLSANTLSSTRIGYQKEYLNYLLIFVIRKTKLSYP